MPRMDLNSYEKSQETHQSIVLEPEKYVIQIPSLNFDFGGPPILRNLQLNVPKGACCLLVGANGAGKSTLLRILAGKRMIKEEAYILGKRAFVDRPGGVTYLGIEWANNPATKLDIEVGYLIKTCGGELYPQRRDELIRLLDVDPNWHMHQVSDGERRRVQLVIGLLQPWEVLLLDEVTVDLDVMVRSNLFQFLKKETLERKVSILYATHIFDGLGFWPTHVAHIHRGEILSLNPILDIKDKKEDKKKEENAQLRHPHLNLRLSEFPELLDAVAHTQHQLDNGEIADSPLLKIVEKWLRLDFIDRLQKGDIRAHGSGEGATTQHSIWDELSEDVDKYGDKYYNYWKR
ncbi:P-loop containing nucleoside triphosphate hydrolase protein [Neoconidiobolus thromboides FSU 785]|nr:P-loop containing nucleoside triphosphate hydrolase protein [Neoconidiobolus thromboides FSU 785]